MAYYRVEDGPWPVGTTVAAYLTSSLVGGQPVGMAVSSGVASANGVVELGGLTEGSTYTAFGHGGTQQFVAMNQEARIEALEAAGSSGGGGAVTPFKPEDYGAVRNGSTDDTAALKACVAACVAAGVADGTYYGEVQFTAGIYQLSGSLTQGGATKGNSLIPLPVFPDTGKKFILVLKGSEDQGVQWHWNQTVPQNAGVVLRTTVSGTADNTYGRASVIGGPTPEQGYGAVTNVWSNMMIVVDGIEIMVPNNPAICGFDFRGVGEMNFKNGSCLANATTFTRVAASNTWQFGLATPENNNNANSRIGKYVAQGLNYAAYVSEHCNVDHFTAIYCIAGIEFSSSGQSTGHGIHVGHLLTESCDVGIGCDEGSYAVKVTIDTFDFESASFALINDPLNKLQGEIRNVSGISVSEPLVDNPSGNVPDGVRGAERCNIYDKSRGSGVSTAPPAIPASTVAIRNPFWRDCFFRLTGGTVTNVQITDSGGSAQSVATATNTGWIPIPTGAYVTLTYSVVPTSWQWMLL
jgi:hypothetical protein